MGSGPPMLHTTLGLCSNMTVRKKPPSVGSLRGGSWILGSTDQHDEISVRHQALMTPEEGLAVLEQLRHQFIYGQPDDASRLERVVTLTESAPRQIRRRRRIRHGSRRGSARNF